MNRAAKDLVQANPSPSAKSKLMPGNLAYHAESSASELQRFGLLDVRQLQHFAEHFGRHRPVHLHQRNGVAAGRFAADVEGRDVDAGIAQEAGEAADESRLV